MNDLTNLSSLRRLNRSAVHTHALKCAKEVGRKQFTRVSESFIDGVQAQAEALLLELNGKFMPAVHPVIATEEAASFVTGAFMDRAQRAFDSAVARMVQARVQRHPSTGKTLT